MVCRQVLEDSFLTSPVLSVSVRHGHKQRRNFSHFTCEGSFEEEGIFVNGICFTSQGLKATSSYKVVDDIYAKPHYNMRCLTGDAFLEAETRSRKIRRTAQIRNLDLVKPHEHPEPRSRNKLSVLKARGNLRYSNPAGMRMI